MPLAVKVFEFHINTLPLIMYISFIYITFLTSYIQYIYHRIKNYQIKYKSFWNGIFIYFNIDVHTMSTTAYLTKSHK